MVTVRSVQALSSVSYPLRPEKLFLFLWQAVFSDIRSEAEVEEWSIEYDFGLHDRGTVVWFPISVSDFLSPFTSRLTLKPNLILIQLGTGAIFLEVNLPGREPGHSPPSCFKVKKWVNLYFHCLTCIPVLCWDVFPYTENASAKYAWSCMPGWAGVSQSV